MTRRISTDSATLLAGATALALSACMPRPQPAPLEPMGLLPGLVTKAQPEWIPFQVAAGAPLPADPREVRLGEPRAVDVGGEARRVVWSPDGQSLVVEVKRSDEPCEAAWQVPLGGEAARRISGPGTRARVGAFVGAERIVIGEAPCSEPIATAKWTILEVDTSANRRRAISRSDDELVGLTSDGAFTYFTSRNAARKYKLARVPLAGGIPIDIGEACQPLDGPSVSSNDKMVFGCGDKDRAAQVRIGTSEGGVSTGWSSGGSNDVDAVLSADGATVAFASTRAKRQSNAMEGAFQIYAGRASSMELHGTPAERVTFAGDNNRAPALGPNGRIAYLSDRAAPGGPLGVVVARFDAP